MIEYDARAWARIPLMLRGSVLPRLAPRVAASAVIGFVAYWLQQRYGFHLPEITHTLLGAALGLLLVFRTNASYDRFWEGRRLVGAYTNRARDLARQVVSYCQGRDAAEAARHRTTILRLIALAYGIVCQSLRGERELEPLRSRMTDGERAALEECPGRPMRVHAWLGQALADAARAGVLPEDRLIVMDPNLSALADAWGGAERIVRTPIPFAYAQHIKTFLILFTFTAPFALVRSMGAMTPLSAALVAFALFGIDEIGVEIEDPFGHDANDLPLGRIGEAIDRDLTVARETLRPPG